MQGTIRTDYSTMAGLLNQKMQVACLTAVAFTLSG
jgi:hypothetical protein